MTGIPPSDESASPSRLILFQGEDRVTRIQVRLEGGTVWLTQAQLAELYQTSLQNVSAHLQDIYASGELVEGATIKDYLIVRTEGARQVRRSIQHYNLDAILAVGYRVRSHRGVQFRQWATAQLREFVVKGFVLDDERLKAPPGDADEDYFAQLLDRIRDIRSSERLFYRKVLDIYATSVDYDPSAESSQRFFATVQNKMHWAAHGHTAAEVIHERADASKPHMGLSHVPRGARVRKQDVSVAKNYLQPDELEALNRIVNAYLEFAELQARGRRLMYMQDWIAKLDDFLRLSDRDILTHAGTVSHEMAQLKAETEYDAYRARTDAEPRAVDGDFEEAVKRLPRQRRRPSDPGGE
ncbi:MAG: virulence RhuM family protein [Gemmatimonadaceae bacterium]|nr:virulence RhuM family protein [Gemmatimonadaceae bacterium]